MHSDSLKPGAFISLTVFFLMLIGSVYFYSERMFFSDTSYMAFQIINKGSFHIEWFRFGAFITQLSILIGVKLGLSIKSILILYSASFHVFYFFVAAALFWWFKAYRWVILFAFYWVLITTTTFFWPINDVHQGMGYLLLMFIALIKAGEKKYNIAIPIFIIVTLGATAIFCHPLIIAALIFLWVYLIAEKKEWYYNTKNTIILSVTVLIIIVVKVYVSNNYTAYDTEKLKKVNNLSTEDVLATFTSSLAKEMYDHMFSNFWLLPVIFLIGIITLLWRKRFFLAIWSLGCIVVYFILLCITFNDYQSFVIESEMMTGIILATTPFVFLTLPYLKRELVAGILLFVFIERGINFYGAWSYFEQREQNIGHMIRKMKEKNFTKVAIINDQEFANENWEHKWAFSAESMLLSACIWDNPVRHIALFRKEEISKIVPDNNKDVAGSFGIIPLERINTKYFHFDTTRPYVIMTYNELME